MKKPTNCFEYWFECYARFNGNTDKQQLAKDEDEHNFYEWLHKQIEAFEKLTVFDASVNSEEFDEYLARISLNGPQLYIRCNKGGKREGAGRPPVTDKAKSRTVRLNDADYKKFKELGGVNWLRYELSKL